LRGDPLADLDEVAVGVAQVAAQFGAPVGRGRKEPGAAAPPLLVDGVDVGDADVEEAADPVGVAGGSSVTVGLSSVGGPPALMTIQLFASAMIVGSPSFSTSPPSTSA
jgi:hypothetical protein